MKRSLAIYLSAGLLAVSQSATACKELVRFPDHLEASTQDQRARFYVVEILSDQGKHYIGRVKQSFGGPLEVGKAVPVRFSVGEEAHAVCPVSIKSGSTYLLRSVGTGDHLEISRFNWLNVPSTHERFPTYVRDLTPVGER